MMLIVFLRKSKENSGKNLDKMQVICYTITMLLFKHRLILKGENYGRKNKNRI